MPPTIEAQTADRAIASLRKAIEELAAGRPQSALVMVSNAQGRASALRGISEFSNVVLAGAKVISGEALLCANLGFGLKLVSQAENVRHTLLFDTGPEGAIFIRNCANLGIRLGEVECIAVSHGHWDHLATLPHAVEAIMKDGGRVAVHVNPGMFNERAIRLKSGMVILVANVPRPADLEQRGAQVVNDPDARLLVDGHFYLRARYRGRHRSRKVASTIWRERLRAGPGSPIRCSW